MGIKRGKWQEQLKAGEASGMSLAGYAAQHGINVRRLYEARRTRPIAKVVPGERASTFVRVKLSPKSSVRVTPDVHRSGTVAPLAMQARLLVVARSTPRAILNKSINQTQATSCWVCASSNCQAACTK